MVHNDIESEFTLEKEMDASDVDVLQDDKTEPQGNYTGVCVVSRSHEM